MSIDSIPETTRHTLTRTRPTGVRAIAAHVRLARPDHWAKNVLMVPGLAVALFYRPDRATAGTLIATGLTLVATCLVASSNYVINEWLDAATDRFHPTKSARPAVAGGLSPPWVLAEWLALGALGLWAAVEVGFPVAVTASALWLMGLLYNVPPVRLKDVVYIDVLSESVNNALRLGLGWFAVIPDRLPPFSLLLAYWMSGAFLMAAKRLSEFRELNAQGVAGDYRRSFRFYTEQKLLISCIFYATLGSQFGGMFMLRYRLELVLMAPLLAGLFAYYVRMAYRPHSAAQHPERLYRDRTLSGYLVLCLVLFTVLMFVRIPWLYRWFSIEPAGMAPLWHLG